MTRSNLMMFITINQFQEQYFRSMYVFDQPSENPPEQKQVPPSQLIKVKPKHQSESETYEMQQPDNNDLIFAFQENEEESQQIQIQKQEQIESEPLQHPVEQIVQKQELTEIVRPEMQKTTSQDATSIISETPSHINIRSHRNQFVIQRILFFPQKFFLYDPEDNLLICARKKLIQINSLFYFFSDSDMTSTKNHNYLGYMISDSSNEYKLYSADDIPLASFEYSIKKNTPGEIIICIGSKKTKSLKSIADQVINETENVFYLHNRQPEKHPLTGKYSTSLEGLGRIPSAKNCAIVYKEKNSLIMGKQKQKHYNLHYGDPWTDFIAFAFAISNYQQKDVQA